MMFMSWLIFVSYQFSSPYGTSWHRRAVILAVQRIERTSSAPELRPTRDNGALAHDHACAHGRKSHTWHHASFHSNLSQWSQKCITNQLRIRDPVLVLCLHDRHGIRHVLSHRAFHHLDHLAQRICPAPFSPCSWASVYHQSATCRAAASLVECSIGSLSRESRHGRG